MKKQNKKIALVLSGCGNKDGTEIIEVVSTMIALTELGADLSYFAPDIDVPIKNFLDDDVMGKRNVMLESARITRGEMNDLKALNPDDFDALVFPGGFGAALHLSTWALAGSKCEVLPDVERVIMGFYKQSKPIGAMCIAPVLIAKVLGSMNVNLTLGANSETSKEIEKTGAVHEQCPVKDYITDRATKVITTPAYMYDDAKPSEVFRGISGLAKELMEMS